MNEHQIQWNATGEEWLCLRCLRSSDHISKEDAEHEVNQFDCLAPVNPQPTPVLNEKRQAG